MIAEAAPPILSAWANFYVMTGSSAAALTGLMFVVITLVTGAERTRRSRDGISTFSTPTVLHFGVALLVCAVLSAPWRTLLAPAVPLGLIGGFGVTYIVRVMHRTRHLRAYTADIEDWAWYGILPLVAYAAILGGAIALGAAHPDALFALAAGVMLLLFAGIHNAWDIVTFLAIEGVRPRSSASNDDATHGDDNR
jgi:hypothetical protein